MAKKPIGVLTTKSEMMKRVVSLDEVVSADISPDSVYFQYIKMLEIEIQERFLAAGSLVKVNCPGCGKAQCSNIYKKMGLQFCLCGNCSSIYVNPRPTAEALRKFYQESNACRYWRKEILSLNESHMQHVHGPRIHWMLNLIDEFLPQADVLVDYQSKYPFFLNRVAQENIFKSIASFEPMLYEQMGLLPVEVTTESNLNNIVGRANLVTAFEVLERMFDPNILYQNVFKLCRPGGLFLLTTATCSGFEYQALGEHAPNINPINRMNLLSLEAIVQKIEAAGFEILELSTPGKLDVEIAKNTFQRSPAISLHPFLKYILEKRDEKTWRSLQDFLQLNRLSSHLRIAAQKKVSE